MVTAMDEATSLVSYALEGDPIVFLDVVQVVVGDSNTANTS